MKLHDMGKYAGCWCIHRLLPEGSKWVEPVLAGQV